MSLPLRGSAPLEPTADDGLLVDIRWREVFRPMRSAEAVASVAKAKREADRYRELSRAVSRPGWCTAMAGRIRRGEA
jgi:hypothetical protein